MKGTATESESQQTIAQRLRNLRANAATPSKLRDGIQAIADELELSPSKEEADDAFPQLVARTTGEHPVQVRADKRRKRRPGRKEIQRIMTKAQDQADALELLARFADAELAARLLKQFASELALTIGEE